MTLVQELLPLSWINHKRISWTYSNLCDYRWNTTNEGTRMRMLSFKGEVHYPMSLWYVALCILSDNKTKSYALGCYAEHTRVSMLENMII